jgi:hypothetical protein
VLLERIELSTSPLPRECSTTELQQPWGQRGAFLRRTARPAQPLPRASRPATFRPVDKPPAKPPTPAEDRAARRAAALRENLKRRKAQARAREDAPGTDAATPPKVAPGTPIG